MAGIVKVKLGDVFDGSSDLIVLPCSTSGSVTTLVDEKLKNYNIPKPKTGMELGGIQILPFEGAENIAQYVAFAVSVDRMTSNYQAIQRIGEHLGKCTIDHTNVRFISAPLLGAGAGGLAPYNVVESLRLGFTKYAAPTSEMTVSIINLRDFRIFSQKQIVDSNITKKRPRVFISYTKSNDRHTRWVLDLADFLFNNGITVRIDQYHLRRGMLLPQWMSNELSMADKVLIISDENYKTKADGVVGGVGWETNIIQGEMFRLPPDSIKFITVVCANNIDNGLPNYLRGTYAFHWSNIEDENRLRNELLKELLDIVNAPLMGEQPIYLS